MEKVTRQGRVWVLKNKAGRIIEDIDTDQIYHNAFLHITEVAEMGQYALGNLEGWKDFPKRSEPGDIIVAGRNFGAGSSRQQAVDCFIALKIGLILAPSYSSIYFRNAVNSGFPVLRCSELEAIVAGGHLETGDLVDVDIAAGRGRNLSKKQEFSVEPMSVVQRDIFRAGNLFAFGRSSGRKD